VNTSPIVGLFADPSGRSIRALAALAAEPADVEVTDDDGVRHRLWATPEDGPHADLVKSLLEAAVRNPVAIADGHHRYETALRYRHEQRASKNRENDPPTDYVMMLFLETTGQTLTVASGCGRETAARFSRPGGASSRYRCVKAEPRSGGST
jgi:uncharacterized protein (DUF1015 family)